MITVSPSGKYLASGQKTFMGFQVVLLFIVGGCNHLGFRFSKSFA